MERIKSWFCIVKKLLKTNLRKTFFINFYYFPLKQALRLPIWIYGKFELRRNRKGKIVIPARKVPTGFVRIGCQDYYVTTNCSKTIWNVEGTIIFEYSVFFYHGTYVMVGKNGVLNFKKSSESEIDKSCLWSFVGSNSKIMCFESIIVENNVRITWECQLYDTSFHYVEDVEKHQVSALTKPIVIRANSWIGNRTTIARGGQLPYYSILGSGSLLNKDYSEEPPCTLFLGSPAKPKSYNKKWIFDEKEQKLYDEKFGYGRTRL